LIGELIECEGVAQGLDAYRLKQFGHRLYSAGIAESSDQIGIERRKACDHDHIPVKILLAKPAGELDPVHANHDHIHHHHRGFFRLEGLGEFAPICRDPRAIAKAFRISGAAAEITLEQLNADAAPLVVPAEHGTVDMANTAHRLAPGGHYRVTFAIDPLAEETGGSLIGRIVFLGP